MSKLGTCANWSSSSGGASGQASASPSQSPLTAGTSLPVTGSVRMAIVPPVETTTTAPGIALRADLFGDPELFLDPLRLGAAERQPDGREHEQEADQKKREHRRGRPERVEVGPDAAGEGDAADLERQRVGRARLEEDAAVVVVPREGEPEQEAAEDPGPDKRQRHLTERALLIGTEVACCFLHPRVVPVPDREHDEEAERDPPDDVRRERSVPDRGLQAQVAPEELCPDGEQEARRHQRQHDHVESGRVRAKTTVPPERHRERKGDEGDDRAGREAEPERVLRRGVDVRGMGRSAGHGGEEKRPPPDEAQRPLERERDAAVVALERQDRHHDHRAVEEDQEQHEVGAEAPLRPVALLRRALDDAVLSARHLERSRRHKSSRRFEKRVITNTPATSASTSRTAAAAPCGYCTAPTMYELTIVPTDWT